MLAKPDDDVPIYWINLDSNMDRRISMQNHLAAIGVRYHRRIPALTPETCNLLMVETPCFRVGLIISSRPPFKWN
jgi:hypothetical protein